MFVWILGMIICAVLFKGIYLVMVAFFDLFNWVEKITHDNKQNQEDK